MSLINELQKVLLITFYSSECLSIKGAEQLRVTSPWLVFLMLDTVKMICSVVENFGDDEGAFPSWSELVRFLLIHSKNQVSLLKCSTPHVSGMESM